MSKESLQEFVRDAHLRIAQGEIGIVLDRLLGYMSHEAGSPRNVVLLLQARYSRLQRDNLRGVISRADFHAELNTLTQALLSIIDEISEAKWEMQDLQATDISSGKTVSWLHLSDLHIGCKERSQDWECLRDALLRDLLEHRKLIKEQQEHLAGVVFEPDLILITGDIAYRATEKEYEEAERLLESVWAITGLGKDQTFAVPGNHDVNRAAVLNNIRYSTLHDKLGSMKEGEKLREWIELVDKVWEEGYLVESIREKFDSYLRFANKCTAVPSDELYYVSSVQVSGVNLEIVGLNSALMSWRDGEDTSQELWIGEPQFRQINDSLGKDTSLRIALVHHPREALHGHDVEWTWERVEKRCQILLHGHLHKPKALLKHDPEYTHLCLSGGSVHEGGVWRSQHYSYGQLDLETGMLDLYLRMTNYGTPEPVYVHDNQTWPRAGANGHIQIAFRK